MLLLRIAIAHNRLKLTAISRPDVGLTWSLPARERGSKRAEDRFGRERLKEPLLFEDCRRILRRPALLRHQLGSRRETVDNRASWGKSSACALCHGFLSSPGFPKTLGPARLFGPFCVGSIRSQRTRCKRDLIRSRHDKSTNDATLNGGDPATGGCRHCNLGSHGGADGADRSC